MAEKRKVFVMGRSADLNGGISILKGDIVKAFPNYTKVYAEPPQPKHRDEFVFELTVDADKINEVPEAAGQPPSLLLWDGPKNNRSYGSYKVLCVILPLTGASEATPSDAGTEIEKLQRDNKSLFDRLEAAIEEGRADKAAITDAQAKLEEAHNLIGELQARPVPGIKDAINVATDSEVEAMPYIGPSNLQHLRTWAKGG